MNLSSNNNYLRQQHVSPQEQKYALRKLSIGVGSVLIATLLMGIQVANADTKAPINDNTVSTSNVAAVTMSTGSRTTSVDVTTKATEPNNPAVPSENQQETNQPATSTITSTNSTISNENSANSSTAPSSAVNSTVTINNWNATLDQDTVTLNYYTGNSSTIVVPNNYDATQALGSPVKQVLVSAKVIRGYIDHGLPYDSVTSLTFSSNGGGKVIASDGDWSRAFYLRKKLTTLDLTGLDTHNVTDMSYMFADTPNLTTITGLDQLDTASVTNINSMFLRNGLTNIDLSNWNTSKLTNMAYLFNASAAKAINLTGINTSNVTDMSWMFANTPNLAEVIGLNDLDTTNVANMSYMFANTNLATADLSKWQVNNVANMRGMFLRSKLTTIGNLSHWNVGNVTDMDSLFGHTSFTTVGDLSGWQVGNVTNMNSMFSYANLTDLGDINQWDVTKVTDMYMMFAGSQIKNNHFSDWNISNVSKMDLMFMDTPVTVYYLWGQTDHPATFTNNNMFLASFADRPYTTENFVQPLIVITGDENLLNDYNFDADHRQVSGELNLTDKATFEGFDDDVHQLRYAAQVAWTAEDLAADIPAELADLQTKPLFKQVFDQYGFTAQDLTTSGDDLNALALQTLDLCYQLGSNSLILPKTNLVLTGLTAETGTPDLTSPQNEVPVWQANFKEVSIPTLKLAPGATVPETDQLVTDLPVGTTTTWQTTIPTDQVGGGTATLTVTGNNQQATIEVPYQVADETWTKTDEQKTYTYEYRTWYQYDSAAGAFKYAGGVYTKPMADSATHDADGKLVPWLDGQKPVNQQNLKLVVDKYTSNLGNVEWRIDSAASQGLDQLTKGYLVKAKTGYTIKYAPSEVSDADLYDALNRQLSSKLTQLLGNVYYAQDDSKQSDVTIPGLVTGETVDPNNLQNQIIDIYYVGNREPVTVSFYDPENAEFVGKQVNYAYATYDWTWSQPRIDNYVPQGYHFMTDQTGAHNIPGYDLAASAANPKYRIQVRATDNNNFIYYVQKDQNLIGLNPFDKATVKDPDKLTDQEKTQVEANIKQANGDKHITTIEVGDDGNTTLTFEDGTKSELTPDQTIIAYTSGDPLINTGDADADLTSFDKASVKDPDHLTNDEKSQVVTNIKKTNGDKHIATIDVKDNGRAIITFDDGTQKELSPDQTIIAYTSGDPLINTGDADTKLDSFNKTPVKDPSHLTDDEKRQISDNIKKTNSDKHISTIDVKDNGRTIITFEDGTQKELTPEETITQLPAEKPEDQSTTTGKTDQQGIAVIGTSTAKSMANQSRAQQQLPQTGDNHEAAVAGLGLAVAMMSMFGLKKRKED